MSRMDDLRDKLRRGLGNLTTAQLSDDQAVDAIMSAVNEYSKHKPIKVLDFFATVKDKELYDLSEKKRILRVKEVFYNAGSYFFAEEFWPDWSAFGRLEGISLFDNPSIWLQYIQRLEQYKAMFNGDFEYDPDAKMLRLIPPPSTTGLKVVFIWTQAHMEETIPEGDVDTVMLWAKGEAKEMIASKKGNEIQSVSGYGESVSFGATSDSLMKEAQDFKARFERKFGGSVFMVG